MEGDGDAYGNTTGDGIAFPDVASASNSVGAGAKRTANDDKQANADEASEEEGGEAAAMSKKQKTPAADDKGKAGADDAGNAVADNESG